MFDTPAARYVYDDALTRHDELMSLTTPEAISYQRGYASHDERYQDIHEYWRAGVQNRFRHKHATPKD